MAAASATRAAVGSRLWRTNSHGTVTRPTATAAPGVRRRASSSHAASRATVSEIASDSERIAASQLVIEVVSPSAASEPATTRRAGPFGNHAAAAPARKVHATTPTSAWTRTSRTGSWSTSA